MPTIKHCLSMRDFSAEQITLVLDTAEQMKKLILGGTKRLPHLQGKSIVTLFYENSTRTRMSFELASKYMSAVAANISASASSVAKGETLLDTGRTLERMGTDVLIVRHPMAGAPMLLAQHCECGIINAGDGMNEHPTQALLDLFTMRERFGGFDGLTVAIVGDVLHSRVARSNLWALLTLGANVRLAGPPTLIPMGIGDMGAQVTTDVEEALTGADVVMGLRVQKERQQRGLFPDVREYAALYGINAKRLSAARDDVLVMHPGPMNRGAEISSDVADGAFSKIEEQVTNGVAVRMALLYLMTKEGE